MAYIQIVKPEDHDKFYQCITASFIADPMIRFIFPEADRYLRYTNGLARLYTGDCIGQGTAYMINDFAGVAAWLAPGVHPDQEKLGEYASTHCHPERIDEFYDALSKTEQYHPNEPYWYLPIIVLDPVHWGQGLGTKLMQYMLDKIDAEKKPIYLESSNPANVNLYEKLGFEICDKINLGGKHIITPMVRSAIK